MSWHGPLLNGILAMGVEVLKIDKSGWDSVVMYMEIGWFFS